MRVLESCSFWGLSLVSAFSSFESVEVAGEHTSQLQTSNRDDTVDRVEVPFDVEGMHSELYEVPGDLKVERKATVFTHVPTTRHLRQSLLARGHAAEVVSTAPFVVSSCDLIDQGGEPWDRRYREALLEFCKDEESASMMEATLDPEFQAQYDKWYKNGWTEKAWVNYVGVKGPSDPWGLLTKKMAASALRASEYPVVIVNFGEMPLTDVPSADFPNVVLFHAKGLPASMHASFNFNKLRAILMARVKTGLSLDGDMLMVSKQADSLLDRTREEITETYPFPMLPVHFLDRDPADKNMQWRPGQGNYLPYTCDGCPKETMRWGQAQPSWSFWSFPFVSRWLNAKLRGEKVGSVDLNSVGEDEDLLNVALWAEGANKSWCQFQPPGNFADWIPNHLLNQQDFGELNMGYDDPHYFPHGVPMALLLFHGHKDVADYDTAIDFIKRHEHDVDSARPYVHMGKFYSSYAEMKVDDPDLKCLL